MSIGANIKAARKAKKMTQKRLSEESGVAEITIRQYEANKREPKTGQLRSIATALGTTIDYLLQVHLDDQTRQFLDRHPNTPITDEGDKISIQISGPDENLDEEGIRQKSLFEFYGRLTTQGREKVCDYAYDLSNVPEYQNDEYKHEQAEIKKYMKSLRGSNDGEGDK